MSMCQSVLFLLKQAATPFLIFIFYNIISGSSLQSIESASFACCYKCVFVLYKFGECGAVPIAIHKYKSCEYIGIGYIEIHRNHATHRLSGYVGPVGIHIFILYYRFYQTHHHVDIVGCTYASLTVTPEYWGTST